MYNLVYELYLKKLSEIKTLLPPVLKTVSLLEKTKNSFLKHLSEWSRSQGLKTPEWARCSRTIRDHLNKSDSIMDLVS